MYRSTIRQSLLVGAGLLACAVLAMGAGSDGAALAQVAPELTLEQMKAGYARPRGASPAPADNATTPVRVELGRRLFFDPRLSGSGAISCASCHNPSFGWEDGLPRGIGHNGQPLARSTPTVLNVGWGGPFFWDGRADTLERQAVMPIASAAEMNMPHDHAVARVRGIEGYRDAFAQAYPGEAITIGAVGKALAAYERTLVSAEAPFDRWIRGEARAISPEARRGFVLFNTTARCAVCHSGWRFTDDGFHDIGVATTDEGRATIAPGIEQLRFAFKTPSLRNIDQRAPYMHNGSLPTLDAVVDFYDAAAERRPSVAEEVAPLGLTTEERSDLVAFLRTLTSNDPPQAAPILPR
jgi:cytochrome c peroxidase